MVRQPPNFRPAFWAVLFLMGLAPPHPASGQGPELGELARLYILRGDSLLWFQGGRLSAAAASSLRLLTGAADHGLDPSQYTARGLDSLARGAQGLTAEEQALLDRRLSHAVLRFLHDVRGRRALGQARPDLAAAVLAAIAADSLPGLAAALEPQLVQYRNLRRALARYRMLAEDTSFRALPAAGTVHPGEPYEGAGRLAALLDALGDLPPDAKSAQRPGVYDGPLLAAITRFQDRHSLPPDGVIGPRTFRELNTPLRWRIRQLELAMERLRRLPAIAGGRIVVVNVPAFRLFAFDSAGAVGRPALESRVVVGRALDTRTPAIYEEMRYIDFWPYWNLPRSIMTKELLPALRRHPEYLRENRMELVDTGGRVVGDEVTSSALAELNRGALRVRQRPGPGNALGPVKFVFPNADDVYIHGTPEPGLFGLARRDLSHGCIRVEDIDALATWVLGGTAGWTGDSTAAALAAGQFRRLKLARPLPVAIVYTTAAAGPSGEVFFHHDLYNLDQPLDSELRLRSAGSPTLRWPRALE